MSAALDLNRRLAEALGWTNIVDVGNALLGMPPWGVPEMRGQAAVPNWAGCWKDCGPLMVKYHIYPAVDTCDSNILFSYFGKPNEHGNHAYEYVYISSHPNPDAAARSVVVEAVISELEAAK